MKNCTELAPLLSAFFDGELPEAQCAEIRAHLAECEACREKLAAYAAMSAGIADAFDEAEVPEGFRENVMTAVRAEKNAAPKRAKRRTWQHLMPIAACAAVVLLAVTLFPGMSKMSENLAADTAAPMAVPDSNGMGDASDAAESADTVEDQELATGSYTLSLGSPYRDDHTVADGEAASETDFNAQSPKSADVGGSSPYHYSDTGADDYFCEAREIDGEEGLLWVESNGAVLLTLYGVGATEYVTENGGVEDGAGYYYLPLSSLYALPDTLYLSPAQALALEQAPEDAEWVLVNPYDECDESDEEEVPHA